MCWHLPEPLYSGVLVGRVGLSGSDIDLARDGLVDEGLPVLLQQLDLPLRGLDAAPDAPVGAVEKSDDGSSFREGWNEKA